MIISPEARFGGILIRTLLRGVFSQSAPVIFFSLVGARLLEYRKFGVVGAMRLLMSVCHCESAGGGRGNLGYTKD